MLDVYAKTRLELTTLPSGENGFDLMYAYNKASLRNYDWFFSLKKACFSDLCLLISFVALSLLNSLIPLDFLQIWFCFALAAALIARIQLITIRADLALSPKERKERVIDLTLLQRIHLLRKVQNPSIWNRIRYDHEGNNRFHSLLTPSYTRRIAHLKQGY